MKTETQSMTVAQVDISGGRRFEATLVRSPAGEPVDLILSVSFASDGRGWREHAGTIALPPAALPQVRAALQSLE